MATSPLEAGGNSCLFTLCCWGRAQAPNKIFIEQRVRLQRKRHCPEGGTLRKRNHRPSALGGRQVQVSQAAPVFRGFWVKQEALCPVAPHPRRHAPGPQADRTIESSPVPLHLPELPWGQLAPAPAPQAGGLLGPNTKPPQGPREDLHSLTGFSGNKDPGYGGAARSVKVTGTGVASSKRQSNQGEGPITRRQESLSSPECLTERPSFSNLDLS